MQSNYRNLSILLLLQFMTLSVKAQNNSVLNKITIYLNNQLAIESVYLHLNKSSYNFGDTIWYKAYTVIGQHHQLSAMSGVLYVELYSPSDSLVTRQLVPLHAGIGWNGIGLANELKPGYYRLRAYTRWMRNFGSAFFDSRVLICGVVPAKTMIAAARPDVQFFPEGGSLVAAVRSRVAFKSVGTNGLGTVITGIILDTKGDTAAVLTTRHLGMGGFVFTPKAGETYIASINYLGSAFRVAMPPVQPEGYVLAVNNSLPDSIFLRIAVNDELLNKEKGNPVYIIGQSRGKIYYSAKTILNETNYTAGLDRARLPSGIIQFTLFNKNGLPVAERLAYEQGSDTLQLQTDIKGGYIAGQQMRLTLDAANSRKAPALGSFSAAVVKDALGDENSGDDIIDNLLLTADIKGYVERPGYYFNHPNEQTRADLDLLLLTQGYRRFEWKRVLDTTSSLQLTYLTEHSLQVSGLAKTTSGKPAPKAEIILAAMKAGLLTDTTTDDSGHFAFSGLTLQDTTMLILRAKTQKGGDRVRLSVVPPVYPALSPQAINYSLADTVLANRGYTAYRREQDKYRAGKGRQLKEVSIHDKVQKQPDLSRSSNMHGGGNADQVIMSDKIGDCVTLSQCLTGKVYFTSFTNGVAVNMRIHPDGGPMSVIVDGAILSPSYLDQINPADVYSVEVLRSGASKAIYGNSIASGGALVITLKNGSESRLNNPPSQALLSFPFMGYAPARVFYAPKYRPDEMDAPENTAVYWSPNIITGKDGKADISYQNLSKGSYRLVIEGIDEDGNLGRTVYKYEVQ